MSTKTETIDFDKRGLLAGAAGVAGLVAAAEYQRRPHNR
jgi:hypothetical protein